MTQNYRNEFTITPAVDQPALQIAAGLQLRRVAVPEAGALGRVLFCRLDRVQPHLYPFYELVNRSFNPKWGYCLPAEINSGVSIVDFLARRKPESRRMPAAEIDRCLFACNTLHTNFVRGNGFVISSGNLIYKPPGAVALDGTRYRPLGYHPDQPDGFAYEALILSPPPIRLASVPIIANHRQSSQPPIELAISGPAIVRAAKNVAGRIPVRLKAAGQTVGNEVNYDPLTLQSSFTAFGVTPDRSQLITASIFAGRPAAVQNDLRLFQAEPDQGVTLVQMARLLIRLGAIEAIAGGGAADTQQYVYGQEIWAGQPRHQPDRPQVEGLRGLGAIFSLSLSNGSMATKIQAADRL